MRNHNAGNRYALAWGGVAGWLVLGGALPGMAQVTGLNGTVVTPNGSTLTITGGQLSGSKTNLFHSFQDFNLGAGLTADFDAAPQVGNTAIANIFARVIGGNASYIDGLLKVSNGTSNLFFINPAGILTGVNARIEVPGSFTATTSNRLGFAGGWMDVLGNPDFSVLEGAPTQFQFSLPQTGTGSGAIVNEGDISVGSGQDLRLLGGTVLNTGTLSAPGGNVTIAAVGVDRTVNIAANGAVSFGSNAGGSPPLLTLKNVPELLTGRSPSVQQASRIAIAPDGTVRLDEAELPTTPGTAIVTGKVDVTGLVGGGVEILGDRLALLKAEINASGQRGGGQVRIGGDYQGQGATPTAQQTVFDRESVIQADAIEEGNGGRVIVWADGNTRFYGDIRAQGGPNGGNGGWVEVSGKQSLTFDGTVKLQALQGVAGTLLLDPENVIIVDSITAADDAQLNDGIILENDSPGTTFYISNTRLRNLLETTGNVAIAAANTIEFQGFVRDFSTNSNDLSLTASNILIPSNSSVTINGDLSMNAATIGIFGDLESTQGSIQAQATQNITVADVRVLAGQDLNLQAPSSTLVTSTLKAGRNLNVQTNQPLSVVGSTLLAKGNLSLNAAGILQVVETTDANNTIIPSIIAAGGNVTLSSNQIEIQALQSPESSVRSGGNLQLVSPNGITGNARLGSGGNFSAGTGLLNQVGLGLNGVISSNGNVSFGDYTGSSLKVEARGSIQAGNITINGGGTFAIDPTNPDPDLLPLNSGPAVVLRAGVSSLRYSPDGPGSVILAGTDFSFPTAVSTSQPSGSISVGQITTSSAPFAFRSDFEWFPHQSVRLEATGNIQTGDISTQKSDIYIAANGDIKTGILTTGGQSDSRNQSRVELLSNMGNIQVSSIDSGSGGILVQAGQSFRALGTTFGAGGGGNFIIDDPSLTDYLVSLGYDRQDIDNADLRLASSAKVSIIARPSHIIRNTGDNSLLDGYRAPVVIQYGDRAQTLVDTTFSFNTSTDRTGKILIQGDSQQAFRMGLAYDGQPPFVLNNFPGDPIPAQNAITSPNIASLTTGNGGNGGFFYLRDGRPLVYNSTEFPATASGLVGGIQIGAGTDSSLYSSVQSQIFNPVIKPIDPPVQPPVTPIVTTQPDVLPTAPGFQPTAATQAASTVAQRDPKTGQLLCPSGTPTANIALRSAPAPQPVPSDPAQPSTQDLQAQTDPCHKERPDDKILLQLLQDGPNLTGIPQLRPEDLTLPR